MNDKGDLSDAKTPDVCATFDISSMFSSVLDDFAEKRGITVAELASQLQAAEQKKRSLQKQEDKKEEVEKEEKTDFSTFQEVADYLDSALSYIDKEVFLEYGDQNELYHLHFGFGLFLRNKFVYGNKSNLELAKDCSRITGGGVFDDFSNYEFYVTDGDSFGGELMELYYMWLKMISPFS